MDAPKEISIRSSSILNEDQVVVETVIEDEIQNQKTNTGDDAEEVFPGRVVGRATTTPDRRRRRTSVSSWASNEDVKRKVLQSRENLRDARSTPSRTPSRLGLRRTTTPTMNNLSTGGLLSEYDDSIDPTDNDLLSSVLLPPTLILDGGYTAGGTKQKNAKDPPKQSSFRKWLAEGMLDTLNVVAGITLSTTGTILSPPIAITKNVMLPALLGLLVDALDTITPPRFQDWFRILSSSVYHLFSQGKTQPGLAFQKQVGVTTGSFLEVLSAPESRQAVVDGMATGVKLADALHTPQMEVFLDQLSILGCRLVDAMASGKTKEFLQNSKALVWKTIELASDPNTTLALAEVTAHLCHALEEVDHSFGNATCRQVRNAQNERTYLRSTTVTQDYPSKSMETIILSSLGLTDDNGLPLVDDVHVDDDENTTHSVPSNVAIRVDTTEEDHTTSHFEKCKSKLDLEFLQDKILNESRSRARPVSQPLSTNAWILSHAEGEGECHTQETGREALRTKEPKPPVIANEPNPDHLQDLYTKFESMPTNELDTQAHVQFYNAINDLLAEKRKRAEQQMARSSSENNQCNATSRSAKVRRYQRGIEIEEKYASRYEKEEYSKLRRSWKLPSKKHIMLGCIIALISSVWIGFGMYGMYTFLHRFSSAAIPEPISIPAEPTLRSRPEEYTEPNLMDATETRAAALNSCVNESDPKSSSNRQSNEIVIRIVKEVVHVRDDGSRVETLKEGGDGDNDDDSSMGFSREEVDRIQEVIASIQR